MKRKVFVFVSNNHVWEDGSRGWTLFDNLKKFHFGEEIHNMLISYKDPVDQELTIVAKLTHANLQKAIKSFSHPDCGLRICISVAKTEDDLGLETGFWIKEIKVN